MKHDLNIVGTIHRKSQHIEDQKKRLTRRYAKIDNAVIGLTRFMMMYGYVGDVCEVHHAVSGHQLGTIKLTLQGQIKTNWV